MCAVHHTDIGLCGCDPDEQYRSAQAAGRRRERSNLAPSDEALDRILKESIERCAIVIEAAFRKRFGIEAARLPDSPSVPQDEPDPLFILVPVEPTEEMVEAYCRRFHDLGFTAWANLSDIWPHVLNAVPTIPGGGGNRSLHSRPRGRGERAATEVRRKSEGESDVG